VRDSVRRLAGAVTIGAGLGLLLVAVLAWRGGRPVPQSFGVTRVPAPAGSPQPHPSKPAPPAVAGPPVTLTIPSQQVRARVLPVADVGGVLQVPDDPAQVGWWNASAPAGSSRGSVVIDGHVDSAVSGPGALFRLDELRTGDRIVLGTKAGGTRSYAVTGRRVYRKAAGLPPELFDSAGPPRLVLISCGGPFDSAAGSYLDNIVVFAAPA